MLKKLSLITLSLATLNLLTNCKTIYVPSDCLILPEIQITQKDKKALKKYQSEFSHEFIKSLVDNKEIRTKLCQ